jgi:hypothetical protein
MEHRPFRLIIAAAVMASACGKPPSGTPLPAIKVSAQPAGGYVSSADPLTGQPRFLWATATLTPPPGSTPERAARQHLAQFAGAYAVPVETVREAELKSVHDVGRGAVLAELGQRLDGVEVYRGTVRVLMKPSLELVAISGNLAPGDAPRRAFSVAAENALALALADRYQTAVPASSVVLAGAAEGGYQRLTLDGSGQARASGVTLDGPARVKPMYFRDGTSLRPAYFVEFFAHAGDTSNTTDAYRYLIAADDGEVLERRNLVADDSFNYRVWAEPTAEGRPLDAPQADFTPHPTGVNDDSAPAFIPPSLVAMETFKTKPVGFKDPWLAATAIQTSGNNADAYADFNAPDGFSNGDIRATTTTSKNFDRVYDTSAEPLVSPDQQMAAVTHLFYAVNWLHDYFYDSGFDEAAGNAQASNFSRGGLGGDALRAEAQDGALAGSRNNANMATPADGTAPRMQMFLWTGLETRALSFTPGSTVNTGSAAFGAKNFNLTAEVVLSVDATAPPNDGCTAPTNSLAGKIALVDRGTCAFALKAAVAQAAGAVGLIVANNASGNPPAMGGADPTVTISVLSITQADGNALKAALQNGPVSAAMFRQVSAERAGDLDTGIVAHEWGHYFHHRLADCGIKQCSALSEGWGDFVALHLSLRAGDNLDGTYATGGYGAGAFNNASYFGLRRYPYSADLAKNPQTFKLISDGVDLPAGPPVAANGAPNSEVHNAGEIWAMAMFEVYVALQKAGAQAQPQVGFDTIRRRMADVMVAGLRVTPPDATFTEQRDAILAAIAATSSADLAVASAAFAKRGLGSCAVSPPRDSATFAGAVESFETKPILAVGAISIDDGDTSCDGDGILDAGETGTLTVQVINGATVATSGAIDVTVSSTNPKVSFPGGATTTIAGLAALASGAVTFEVALAADTPGIADLPIDIKVENAGACAPAFTVPFLARGNSDDAFNASASDDVEATATVWTTDGTPAWKRIAETALDHAWRGPDIGTATDVRLISPPLQVSATDPFKITFNHRFDFEFTPAQAPSTPVFYDGGVIEFSTDDGATWTDVATLVATGYTGALSPGGGNQLGGRMAFAGKSATYPAFVPVSLDLGTALAGETVRLRFRIGTDVGSGATGWDIDDLVLTGIGNTPFTKLVPDVANICPTAPVATAGPDQIVAIGSTVVLDGSGSTDQNGDPLAFLWSQSSGPSVTLTAPASVVAIFKAPPVAVDTTLTFNLEVNDGRFAATDSVAVTVLAPVPDAGVPDASPPDASPPDARPPDAAPSMPDAGRPDAGAPRPDAGGTGGGGDSGCGCVVGGRERTPTSPGAGALLLGLGGLVLTVRRRRHR